MTKEPTVESVRNDIRDALFQICFMQTGLEIEQRSQEQKNACVTAQNFAAFAVNSGLITRDEGNDWLDVIYGRGYPEKCLASVMEKYCPTD